MKTTVITINGFEMGRGINSRLTKVTYQIGSLQDEKSYWVSNYKEFKEYLKEFEDAKGKIILTDDLGEVMTIKEFNEFMR